MLRKFSVLVLLVLSLSAFGRLWYFAKDGFNINRILYPLAKEEDSSQEFSALFNGPYRYLARGRQCYAFESLDQRYVLKIPRFDRYRLPLRWKASPFSFLEPMKKEIFDDRQGRLFFTLDSFRIAARELKEKTGIAYLHLHETAHLPKQFVLIDRLHRKFTVDLNRIAFVLQEKKPLMMPLFLNALKNGDRAKAKAMLDSFLDFLDDRARLGIFNRDPSFLKNFGWEEETGCIQIDIGSFYRKPNLTPEFAHQYSLLDGSGPLREWLKEIDPELLAQFEGDLYSRTAKR